MAPDSIKTNKKKIINDPVYGFIKIKFDILYDLIQHPYFQRLRRIKQLGLTNFVYPGAMHSRFQHALGCIHLMSMALDSLRSKGIDISEEEYEAASIAILLHDIGHGPFSHSLENTLIEQMSHEEISLLLMNELNDEFDGKLNMAIQIFRNHYPKKFLNQLVTGQLDMDRLDYLKRDSFFTGVTEGTVGSDRIIKMLTVVDDELVVESKGIYSIEKFLIARRLMYWQVYFHKAVLSAENLLINVLTRAKQLAEKNIKLYATPALTFFLYNKVMGFDFNTNREVLENFILLDDTDILASAKNWVNCGDKTLEFLSYNLLNRQLYAVEIQDKPFDAGYKQKLEEACIKNFKMPINELPYYIKEDTISAHTYTIDQKKIRILYNNGNLKDISEASEIFDLHMLAKDAKKYYLCYPKNCLTK